MSAQIVINGRFLTQPLTGVQRYALEMSSQLAKRLADVTLLTPGSCPPERAAQLSDELPVKTYCFLRGHLWEQVSLPTLLKKQPVTLVNLCNTAPLRIARQVTVLHDMSFFHEPRWFSRRFRYLYRFLIPRVARRSSAIVTDSEFSKREIVKYLVVDENRVTVVPAAPADIFRNSNGTAGSSSADGDRGYLLAVSSIDPRKNLGRLIAAFDRAQLSSDVDLVVVGAGSRVFADSALAQSTRDIPGVRFEGSVSDVRLAQLYRGALACVYPTLYEGFGLPPIEAMASSCAVVTSRVASLPEVCGEAALYVDPLSVDDIARGLREIVQNDSLRAELVMKGAQRASEFTWERSGERFAEVVREVSEG